jgi:hypothetical protein
LGTTALLLFKNFDPSAQQANWEECFVWGCIGLSVSTVALLLVSGTAFSAALMQKSGDYQELVPQESHQDTAISRSVSEADVPLLGSSAINA